MNSYKNEDLQRGTISDSRRGLGKGRRMVMNDGNLGCYNDVNKEWERGYWKTSLKPRK